MCWIFDRPCAAETTRLNGFLYGARGDVHGDGPLAVRECAAQLAGRIRLALFRESRKLSDVAVRVRRGEYFSTRILRRLDIDGLVGLAPRMSQLFAEARTNTTQTTA